LSIEYSLKKLKYLKNYMKTAKKIKKIVLKYDPEAEVHVFGSVIKGKYTASSDIDILIISQRKDLEYKIKIEILKQTDAPIEIHFITKQQHNKWYKKFINKTIKI